MRRTQIYLDDGQDQALDERARALGRTRSDLIREAIDMYLAPSSDERAALAQLRAAVSESAGVAPYLPAGEEYVEQLRAADVRREQALAKRRAS